MAKIMIIDDDRVLLETLEDALSDPGGVVVTMDRTEGAVSAMLANRPDLLILDVMFPENPAGGFELAREIRMREELRRTPIILLTGINQELPGDLSRKDIGDDWFPVQDFLEKPVDLAVLRKRVAELLTEGMK
jgi:DNA-binding response OmpR family regulator